MYRCDDRNSILLFRFVYKSNLVFGVPLPLRFTGKVITYTPSETTTSQGPVVCVLPYRVYWYVAVYHKMCTGVLRCTIQGVLVCCCVPYRMYWCVEEFQSVLQFSRISPFS
uniref:Uncharacterized protein n=1 Tax=Cacopsylla melanoneura TaxID=428564 RepID=A0A8D8LTS7_9HEMI